MKRNQVIHGDCAKVMAEWPAECIDLTVTSPPYDNLRDYEGYHFDFEAISKQLYRVTKQGGVVVWVVGDETINGSESGNSFRQALYFMGLGFSLHDTMIWNKGGFSATGSLAVRYAPVFEYMFILSKGNVKTFNPIKDHKSKHAGKKVRGTVRTKNNTMKQVSGDGKKYTKELSQRFNIWNIPPVKSNKATDHPAPFPEALARDHIISWSNPGDLVLDPMCGSGTSLKMAKETGRDWIGIDMSENYCKLSEKRVQGARIPLFV